MFSVAPRDTFNGVGDGRKTAFEAGEAIRWGHLIFRATPGRSNADETRAAARWPPSITRQLSTFLIEPKSPCCSPLMPAAKKSVSVAPPLPPLPKRRPHRPSIWIGALPSLFSWPRNLPAVVNPLMRPSPKFPTRMSLWKLPKLAGARDNPHGELRNPPDANRRARAPRVV